MIIAGAVLLWLGIVAWVYLLKKVKPQLIIGRHYFAEYGKASLFDSQPWNIYRYSDLVCVHSSGPHFEAVTELIKRLDDRREAKENE